MKNFKHWLVGSMIITALLILLTRSVTLTHNMNLHPDEYVFYEAADSLSSFLLASADSYREVKAYPEGAIVLQMPFHLVAKVLNHLRGIYLSPQLCGRVAATFYFTAGILIGIAVLHYFMGAGLTEMMCYSLISVFSLMHIEQSRYGTGDAITLLLCNALLFLTFRGFSFEKEGMRECAAQVGAGLITGILCAVKYPLLFFGLLPITSACHVYKGQRSTLWRKLFVLLIPMVLGFLVVSPKALLDPFYVIQVLRREMGAYVLNGNVTEVGGPCNHFLQLMLYSCLYSGFPMFPFYMFITLRDSRREPESASNIPGFIIYRTLPMLIVLFVAYNVFAKTMFMRTLYPFFFFADLYVALSVGKAIKEKRILAYILTCILLARGCFYCFILTEQHDGEKMDSLISSAVDRNWSSTLLLKPGYFLAFNIEKLIDIEIEDITSADVNLRMSPGQLVIAGNIQYGRGNRYLIPIQDPVANEYIQRWKQFKEQNSPFFVAQPFPDYYYVLFGYWIKGTTGASYEFPTNYIYYRSD